MPVNAETTHLLPSKNSINDDSQPFKADGDTTRKVKVISLITMTYFCVSGGPYGIEELIATAYPLYCLIGLLGLPWFWSLPPALITAEMSSALPSNMGYIIWVKTAFGNFASFQVGCWRWVNQLFDNALYPILFHDYLNRLIANQAFDDWYWRFGVCGMVIVFTLLLNIIGVEAVGKFSILLAIFSIGPFILMIIGGATSVRGELLLKEKSTIDWPVFISVLLWSLNGWDCMGNIAGSVHNPQRTYPLGMTISVALVMLTNAVPIAIGSCLDTDWDSWQEGQFPLIAQHIGGHFGNVLKTLMIVGALVSALGQQNIAILTTAESYTALCHEDLLGWKVFRDLSRWKTPWVSLCFNSLLVLLITLLPFEQAVAVDIFLYCCGLILEILAFVWLKFKSPNLPSPFVVEDRLLKTIL